MSAISKYNEKNNCSKLLDNVKGQFSTYKVAIAGVAYFSYFKGEAIIGGLKLLAREVSSINLPSAGIIYEKSIENHQEIAIVMGSLMLVSACWDIMSQKTGLKTLLENKSPLEYKRPLEDKSPQEVLIEDTEEIEETEDTSRERPSDESEDEAVNIPNSQYKRPYASFDKIVGSVAGIIGGGTLGFIEYLNSVKPIASDQEEINDGNLVMEYLKNYGTLMLGSAFFGYKAFRVVTPLVAFYTLKAVDTLFRGPIYRAATFTLVMLLKCYSFFLQRQTSLTILAIATLIAKPDVAVNLNLMAARCFENLLEMLPSRAA